MRKKLDYLPLVCLIASASYLIVKRFNGEILLQSRHGVGLIVLFLATILLFFKHKLGVLLLGFVILLGLFGAISFSPAIYTMTIGKTWDDTQIPLLFFQPIFLLWATLHFALSGRYYIGILSKKYWNAENINSDEPLKL